MAEPQREILEDAEAIARRAADLLLETCAAGSRGPIGVCLSGGSTPKRLYQLLASAPYRERLPWSRLHWFWGDERCVPPDSDDSNYRMVREAMLDHVPAPAANIHPIITTELDPFAAARAYQAVLGGWRHPPHPLFDLCLLGLGEDGHTASLFPQHAEANERQALAVAVPMSPTAPQLPRVSLSLSALESSGLTLMLVSGAGKQTALRRIAAGEDLPAARVCPEGPMIWLLDRAAAGA